jgi:hypothetical protein
MRWNNEHLQNLVAAISWMKAHCASRLVRQAQWQSWLAPISDSQPTGA